MFDIKPYNKILITQGDTASFTVDIVDLDDDVYEPAGTDVLELNVFTEEETILTKTADLIGGSWVFSLFNNDTKEIAPSVYNYNVILYKDGEPYTIIQTTAFEVLSTVPEGVNPKPTPEPEHYHKFEGWVSNNDGTHTGYCDCGDTITEQCEFSGGICPKCGASDPNYVPEPEHQHNYVAVHTLEPTCTSSGSTLYQCSSCGQEYTGDFVEPLGHDEGHWDYTETNHTKYCNRCGAILVDGPHVYDNDGICIVCGYDIRNSIPPYVPTPNPPGHDHNWVLDSTTQATCLTAGVRRYVCSSCGDTEEVIDVPALGHWYVNGVCVRCGATDPDYVPDHVHQYSLYED